MRIETIWGCINAVDEGEGPVLLLLHPLALAGEFWRPVIDRYKSSFRVIATDARGHGESKWDGQPFTVEDLAEDAAAVLTHVGERPAHVLGLSMGGCTALALACRRPELVDRLVLADTTADYGPGKHEAWAQRADNAVEKARETQLGFQRDRWFSPAFLDESPEEVARVSEIFVRTDSHAHAAACRALGGYDDSHQLGSIAAPTLVVVGEDDYATPPEMARALHAGIPGSSLEVLPETRHMSLIEHKQVWDRIDSHLRGD